MLAFCIFGIWACPLITIRKHAQIDCLAEVKLLYGNEDFEYIALFDIPNVLARPKCLEKWTNFRAWALEYTDRQISSSCTRYTIQFGIAFLIQPGMNPSKVALFTSCSNLIHLLFLLHRLLYALSMYSQYVVFFFSPSRWASTYLWHASERIGYLWLSHFGEIIFVVWNFE